MPCCHRSDCKSGEAMPGRPDVKVACKKRVMDVFHKIKTRDAELLRRLH